MTLMPAHPDAIAKSGRTGRRIASAIHGITAAVMILTVPFTQSSAAQTPVTDSAFVSWARSALHPLATIQPDSAFDDLRALDGLIGDARIVAIAESPHGGAEPLLFRNRLARYLVEEHGFTAIAIESGFVEGRLVNEYVRGSQGDLADVVHRGVTWGFANYPQNAALVAWMRQVNDAAGEARVDFYGFDLSGATNTPEEGLPRYKGTRTALDYVLSYLEGVDPEAHVHYSDRLADFLPNIGRMGDQAYASLEPAQRHELSSIISGLVSLLERRELDYTASGGDAAYRWALQVVHDARQSDILLRNESESSSDKGSRLGEPDARERAQADNVRWILEGQGPDGRVLIFASNPHVAGVALRMGMPEEFRMMIPETARPPAEPVAATPAGAYLRHWYGEGYVTLGNLVGGIQAMCGGPTLQAPPDSTVAGVLRQAGHGLFFINFRDAPDAITPWLEDPRQFDQNPPFLLAPLSSAFDGVVFMESVSSACQ